VHRCDGAHDRKRSLGELATGSKLRLYQVFTWLDFQCFTLLSTTSI
jgi:hypothetical protein